MQNQLVKAFPLMVNSYSKLFGVQVRMQGTSAYTNGTVITIPRLDIQDQRIARLALGYLAHESSHVRYTDFKVINDKELSKDRFLFNLLNILEDSRIEALISKQYIGVYENLSLLNDYYEKEWRVYAQTLNKMNVISIILCFIQTYAQSYAQKFISSRSRASLLFFHLRHRCKNKDLREIARLTKECVLTSENTSDVLSYSKQIYEILKNKDFAFEGESLQSLDKMFEDNPKLKEVLDLLESKNNDNNLTSRYLKERARFEYELGVKPNENNSPTPCKTPREVIEDCDDSSCSSSREDMGSFSVFECKKGNENFLDTIKDTYAIRQNLNLKVRSYIQTYGLNESFGNRIDPLKAQKVCTGELSIFKSKIMQTGFATSIHLLVDVSSSMLTTDGLDTTRAHEACKVSLMMCKALEGIDGIKTMATFFPGIHSEYEVALKENERVSSVAARFDQSPRGSTPLAQALWYAFSKIEKLSCTRNIIIVITDGIPDSVINTKICLDYAKKHDIEIYGISIRSEIIKEIFESSTVISDAGQLEKEAFLLLNQLFQINKLNKKYLTEFI